MLGLGLGLTSPVIIGSHAPLLTPTDILGSSLKVWLSADDHGTARMTDDGSGLISAWTDKIGSTPYTATGGERPTWGAASFNSSYAGLTANGTTNFMTTTTLTAFPTGSTAGSVFIVYSQASASAARVCFAYGGASAGNQRIISRVVGSTSRATVSVSGTDLTDTSVVFDGPHMVLASWSGTTQSGRIDGSDFSPASGVISSLNTSTTRSRIFANNAVSAINFDAGVGRHFMVTTVLTLLQMQQLEGWGAWDSGLVANLPAGHPYKLFPPRA